MNTSIQEQPMLKTPGSEKLKILPRKNFFRAKVIKFLGNLAQSKTIKVSLQKKIYYSKYKRYYKKTYNYLVHYDMSDPKSLPLNLNQEVVVHECRRLSPRKSKVTYGWV